MLKVSTLTPVEVDVLERRAKGQTLRQIGEAIGKTGERVRAIEANGVNKIMRASLTLDSASETAIGYALTKRKQTSGMAYI